MTWPAFLRRLGRKGCCIVRSPRQFGVAILAIHLLMLLPILARHGFDPSVLIVAGDHFVTAGQTPTPIIVRPHSDGYDGQFYYRLALAPFLPQADAFGVNLAHPAWRMQRILLPLLAHVVSFGNATIIPWAFLGINLAGIGAIAALAAWFARRFEFPWLVPAALAIWPGWLIALTHDTTEILAGALLLAALAAYLARHIVAYAALIALATLTRETAILVAGGIALVEAARLLHPPRFSAWRRLAWAVVAMLPFLAWRHIVSAIWHTTPQAHGVAENVGWPLAGWAQIIAANLLNRAIGAAAHPRGATMRITTLAGITLISVFCIGCARAAPYGMRAASQAGLAWGWLLTLALMSVLTANGPWIDPTAYLRAFTECWVAGWVLLGMTGRMPPVPKLGGAIMVFLALRNWELCSIQLQ